NTRSTLIWGVICTTLLVACGGDKSDARRTDSTTPERRGEAVPSSAPIATTGDGVMPSPSVPTPVVPPTPQEVRQAWKEGVALYDGRDYEQASTRLQVVVDARPGDAYAHYLYGLSLWKTGHLTEAETALATSSTLDRNQPKCWINLARVRMQRDDFSGALEAADQALTLDPGSADALHQRGRALAGTNRNDEALAALEQARDADPENGYIANTLGHFLLTAGRIDEAVPHLEAARDRLPEVAFVRNNLGVAYERQGDLDRAVEEYRAAVQSGDPDGKSQASLARLEPIVGTGKVAGKPSGDGTVDGEPTADSGTTDGEPTDDSGTTGDPSR
ncbi:MAG TPA: tetratricopeptide repeat protein, partial [Dongiaceae bacterium]|nr:tetratricopeptide repeat protein [Dongiaceae bacterium]